MAVKICRKLESIEKTSEGYLAKLDKAYMKACFVTDSIVRLRVVFTDDKKELEKPEGSYVLQTVAWEDRLDFLFEGERNHVKPVSSVLSENDSQIEIKSENAKLIIGKDPLFVKLEGPDGRTLSW